ncbi:hypothetical protein SprV_0301078100 [Sparganum proliferum]
MEVLERTETLSIHPMLRQLQLRWSGHLVRMENTRLPIQLFYGDVTAGTCREDGQERRFKDALKYSLERLQISPETWEGLAQNRPVWGKYLNTGAAIYDVNRTAAAKAKSKTPCGSSDECVIRA